MNICSMGKVLSVAEADKLLCGETHCHTLIYLDTLNVLVNSKGTKGLMVQIFRIAAWVLVAVGFVFCVSPYSSFLNWHAPQQFVVLSPVIIYFVALAWSGLFLYARRKSGQFCGSCGNAFYQEPRCSNSKCKARLVAGQTHCLGCGTKAVLHDTKTDNGIKG